jgi:hypothetical protein
MELQIQSNVDKSRSSTTQYIRIDAHFIPTGRGLGQGQRLLTPLLFVDPGVTHIDITMYLFHQYGNIWYISHFAHLGRGSGQSRAKASRH